MANRAHLYALSNQPESYTDRPESITGISEWPWAIPFAYHALLSGSPRLCASLISDGFETEPEHAKTPLYALSGDFAQGLARFERFAKIVRRIARKTSASLIAALDEASVFLHAHQDRYFLLEIIELDSIDTSDGAALRRKAEDALAECRKAGAAIDALSGFDFYASRQLQVAAQAADDRLVLNRFRPFRGLMFDDSFDDAKNHRAMGVGSWLPDLYFSLWNRAEFAEKDK